MNGTRLALFADLDDAVRHLAPAKSAKTDHGDRFDLVDVVAAGTPFRILDQDGRHLAAFVLQPFGQVLWITAAAGRDGNPLCPVIDAHAVEQARRAGFSRLKFRTERPGLVKQARALGWHFDGIAAGVYFMHKEIQ